MRRIGLLITMLLFALTSFSYSQTSTRNAPGVYVQEEDGAPASRVRRLKFANGTVTDNGDGSFSISGGGTSIPFDTVANLPGSPSTNDLAGVTDGSDDSDCTVGGGTDRNICVYSGSAWLIIGDGQSTPASGDSVTVEGVGADTTANFTDGDIDWTLTDGGAGGPDNIDSAVIDLTCTDCINATEIEDIYLLNGSSDVMTGTLTADGLTLGANENITLGSQTLNHDGTDFNFNDTVNVSGGVDDFTTMNSSGSSGLFGSIYNFYRGVTADSITIGSYFKTEQTATGGSSAVPFGAAFDVDVTGGTFNHAVGGIGYVTPGASSVKTSDGGATGFYGGLEGRCDADDNGHACYGLIARATLNDSNGYDYGSVIKAIDSLVELGGSHVAGGTIIANAYDMSGDPSTAGTVILNSYGNTGYNLDSWYKGIINGSAVDHYYSFRDDVDQWTFNLSDTDITNGVTFWLGDAAGTAELSVRDSAAAVVFSADTDGNVKMSDSLTMTTNTDAYILVADGTDFSPVAMSDDATITNAGVVSVVDMTCTDCINATEIEDIYLLNSGDTSTGDITLSDGVTDSPQILMSPQTGTSWGMYVADASDQLNIYNNTASTEQMNFVNAGAGTINVTVDGDLQVSGDDLFMGTNTDAYMLVADGTNYNPVAISGDITITNAGVTTIGADNILESHLKAVDAAVDEECLTYESTTGDFEWQTCGGAETNSLETTITGILDTEIFVGNGANSGTFVAVSGDATLANTGALTIAANSVALTADTTGNYTASIADAGNGTITVVNGVAEGGAVTLDAVDLNCTDCINATEIADVYLLNNGDATTGDLDFNDGTTDSPKATFTPQTGQAWDIYVEDTGDDLQIEITSGVEEIVDLNNTGAGSVSLTMDGDLTVTGGDITLGTTSIFSGGDTASLNNIDAIDATTEVTLEAAIDSLTNLTAVGTITSGTWTGTTIAVANGGTGATTLNDLITMATHTTGDFVGTITGGDGIQSTGATTGEDIDHTLSLDIMSIVGVDADSSTTGSASGLEIISGEVTLLRGCSDNQTLVWDEGADDWNCETPSGSGTITSVWTDSDGDVSALIATTGDSMDAGSADDLEIPNGAAPTVDTTGQIAIDTTDDQIKYYGGSAARVIPYERTKCAVIENLAAADDDFEIGMFNDAVTITGIGLHCAGTCTTGADISLEDRAGNAMTHTVPTHSTGTGATTFQSVTAANGLTAGEGLRFDVDNAVSPETDTYTICYTYTVDAQ